MSSVDCPFCGRPVTLLRSKRLRTHGGQPACPASGHSVEWARESALRRERAGTAWFAAELEVERVTKLYGAEPPLAEAVLQARAKADALYTVYAATKEGKHGTIRDKLDGSHA